VKKVAWFADELGMRYERHDVGGKFGMDAGYLAKNPNALIPTIEDEGLVLWESNAILRYLASRYGGECYWPADPQQRAIGDRWMDWQFGYAKAQYDAFVNLVRRAAPDRDMDAVARSAAAAAGQMAILEDYLAETP
jgi:glutathione S-transferase